MYVRRASVLLELHPVDLNTFIHNSHVRSLSVNTLSKQRVANSLKHLTFKSLILSFAMKSFRATAYCNTEEGSSHSAHNA